MNTTLRASVDSFIMFAFRLFLVLLLISVGAPVAGSAENGKPTTDQLLEQAKKAFAAGRRLDAIDIATRMIEGDPTNPNCYFLRARFYELELRRESAVADYSKIIAMIDAPEARYHRAVQYFLLARIPESVEDFNALAKAMPDLAANHWQRGIALYYNGDYEEGRKQFELHQTVNPNDVENSVWHFLCVARASGFEAAQKSLIPVTGDQRVPMMEVLDLFAGRTTPEAVLEAAYKTGGQKNLEPLQKLYGQFYVALYHEARGEKDLRREHLQKAVDLNLQSEYMWEVARVHLELLNKGTLK